MDRESLDLLAALNRGVIQFRGLYAAWAREHGISYHELLVLYTIRDQGFCTQKQICESYLLPRQTINHVILSMRREGLLVLSREHCTGREKAFVWSERGKAYAAPVLAALDRMELRAMEEFGRGRLRGAAESLFAYDRALHRAMDGEG